MKRIHVFIHVLSNLCGNTKLLVILFFLTSSSIIGQIINIEQHLCEETPKVFTEHPEETLCEEFSYIENWDVVVDNTNNVSSVHGSDFTNKFVKIESDFIIDNNFTFKNCIVNISPGVSIVINSTQLPFPGLHVEDSKLYACDDLWTGIIVGYKNSISTVNSEMEDAERAIFSGSRSALRIETTTFNRNRVGIYLEKGTQGVPVFYKFINNWFTCDAPLNGTVDEITYAGVQLDDASILVPPSSIEKNQGHNRFIKLIHGIYAEGDSPAVAGFSYWFEDLKENGIYIENGFLDLKFSTFTNCELYGIQAKRMRDIDLRENEFNYDDNLLHNSPFGVTSSYTGVLVSQFALDSRIQLFDNDFNVYNTYAEKSITGIQLKGNNGGDETQISVARNDFSFETENGICIYLTGSFPTGLNTQIYNNNIYFDQLTSSASPTALISNGEKNNVYIYGNTFTSRSTYLGNGNGIGLSGSTGLNNHITSNYFPVNFLYGLFDGEYQFGISFSNFQNGTFCGNIIGNANRCLSSNGTNFGTNITENTFIGGGTQLGVSGLIGQQSHQGNMFTQKYPYLFPTYYAFSGTPLNAPFNHFEVHTEQSIENSNPPPYYLFFSEFHPSRIEPDINNEWFSDDPTGEPSTGCTGFETGQAINGAYEKIADGSLGLLPVNQTTIWESERHLYEMLTLHPGWVTTDPAYQSFLNSHQNSSVHQFYTVKQAINNGIKAGPVLLNQSEVIHQSRSSLFGQLIDIETIIDSTSDETALEAAYLAKENLINQWIALDEDILDLNNNYLDILTLGLTNALQLNTGIVTNTVWEDNLKTVYQLSLEVQLYQQGIFDTDQIDQLIAIASQCPANGGIAVYQVRSILPYCIYFSANDHAGSCYPEIESFSPQIVTPEGSGGTNDKAFNDFITIAPNPNTGVFTLIVKEGTPGMIDIYNNLGQLIKTFNVDEEHNRIQITLAESGLYYVVYQIDGHVIATHSTIIAN